MRYIGLLVRMRTYRFVGKFANRLLALVGPDIHPSVRIGSDVRFGHRGNGVVIAQGTSIGSGVTIMHQVTIGTTDASRPPSSINYGGIVISDGVILGAGSKVLTGRRSLVVGKGTVVGANAVLTSSTGDNEVWAGVPARCIRTPSTGQPS